MKRLVVIHATASGPHLLGRALLPLGGKPLLVRMIERVRAARTRCDVVVATTRRPDDDDLLLVTREAGVPIFRGKPAPLLVTFHEQARLFGADVVAALSARAALIDPFVIDEVFGTLERTACDYASNLCPATFPDGMGVCAMRVDTIDALRGGAPASVARPLPRRTAQGASFHVENVRFFGADLSRTVKLAVDNREDYERVRDVFDALYTEEHPAFSLRAMLDHLARERTGLDPARGLVRTRLETHHQANSPEARGVV